MPDTKLSNLTELAATPANDDEVYIRDVSEAEAAESKRISVANLAATADAKISTHANLSVAGTHGSAVAATVNKLVHRDASGRSKFTAPAAAGDALIKGTRATTAELPALTDEKIWKGTGGNVEEVDMPTVIDHELYIPFLAGEYTDPVYPVDLIYSIGFRLDAATEKAKAAFTIPHNFSTLSSAKIKFLVQGGNNNESVDWTFITTWGAVGEAPNNDTDLVTEDAKDIAWTSPPSVKIYEVDITAAFTGIAADDQCYAQFNIDALAGTAPALLVSGIQFTYN